MESFTLCNDRGAQVQSVYATWICVKAVVGACEEEGRAFMNAEIR